MAMFTDDDERLLSKTMGMREKLIESFTKEGIPSKGSDVRVLKEVLDSIDNTILSKAKLKIEETDTTVNAQQRQLLAELVLAIHDNKGNNASASNEAPKFEPSDVVTCEGEDILGKDNLDPADYI